MAKSLLDERVESEKNAEMKRPPNDAGEGPAFETSSRHEPRPSFEKVISDGIAGEDEPMGEGHPSAPFALIFGAYPLLLLVVLAAALAFFAWWARN